MTIQEEIRDGIRDTASRTWYRTDTWGEVADAIVEYLHSQGVVIVRHPQQGSDLTGCVIVAVESLI